MAADHVIIGSGINALVAAALLALKGDKVLVLEREAAPAAACGPRITPPASCMT
jgi:phytoene dehydrogenase-like protein